MPTVFSVDMAIPLLLGFGRVCWGNCHLLLFK